jgi:hypothetical protein
MNSTYYLVRIHLFKPSAEMPNGLTAFLTSQPTYHPLTETDFVFSAPSQTAQLRDKIRELLGSAGTAGVNVISFHSRP